MPAQQTSLNLFPDDTPVDMHIRIYQYNGKYKAELWINGVKPQIFPVNLTPHDVDDLNTELQQTIENISNRIKEDGECDDALSDLAYSGKAAFSKIFSESKEVMRKALQMINKKPGATIEISSEDFFIPWELLYPNSLEDPIDALGFWGMRYILARTIIQDNRPADMISPTIETLCPEVGLIAYKGLNYVVQREIPALEKLHQNKQIQLLSLHPLDSSQHLRELGKFGRFLRKEFHIVHLACHAYPRNPAQHSYLYISDDFAVSMQDFYAYDFRVESNPLVILNACHTGIKSSLNTSNWASLFWERGARGVVATEFAVPDWFAATFIENLYQCLLAGAPIGVGIWATRRHFLAEYGNPLGLAYALYSPPSVRIVSASEGESTWTKLLKLL